LKRLGLGRPSQFHEQKQLLLSPLGTAKLQVLIPWILFCFLALKNEAKNLFPFHFPIESVLAEAVLGADGGEK
jgi:hypothetical protein